MGSGRYYRWGLSMTDYEGSENGKSEVFFQKINVRDLFTTASCGNGLHVTVPAKLVRAFDIESGDELLIRIEEVRYGNVREIPQRVDVTKAQRVRKQPI